MNINYTSMGHKIREQRNMLSWSMEKLAELSDLSKDYVGSIERGQGQPSLLTVIKIANTLNIGLDYLLQDSLRISDLHREKGTIQIEINKFLPLMTQSQQKFILQAVKFWNEENKIDNQAQK